MGRHTNKLLQHLLDNKYSKRDFIELVQKTSSNRDVANLLEKGKFENTTWYVSGQTVNNIMKRLGYEGKRGRKPTRPHVINNTGPRWSERV
jgi:hypothetical protein